MVAGVTLRPSDSTSTISSRIQVRTSMPIRSQRSIDPGTRTMSDLSRSAASAFTRRIMPVSSGASCRSRPSLNRNGWLMKSNSIPSLSKLRISSAIPTT